MPEKLQSESSSRLQKEFILEAESSDDVYVVYFGDGTMQNFYYTEDDAKKAINSEGRIGFFEPHFGIINDELTVMYADDFTTMLLNPRNNSQLNYETQFIISRTYNEDTNTWKNRKVIVDGTIKKGDIMVFIFKQHSREYIDDITKDMKIEFEVIK